MFVWKARHTAMSILFATWIIAYLDRMVMATAIPYIAKDFSLSPLEMGVVMSAFFGGYALCQIPGGILADKFGARKVMVGALLWWSAFTAFTGAVSSLASMIWVRIAFGIGEGIFPAASFKSVSNWFPAKSRGTATGFMLSSNALGPALAPLFVVAIMAAWGWRTVFYSLFIPGLVIVALIWWLLPDNPADKKGISAEELAELQQGEPVKQTEAAQKLSFFDVIKVPAVWQCFLILFFYNMTMWGFMSWLPSYLVKARGFEMVKMGITASLPFIAGTFGMAFGGWISDKYFKNNRKIPLIFCQLVGAIFLYLMYTVDSTDTLIVYQTIAGGILFTGAGALWALPMSAISKEITGRAMGIVNTAGQIAGFLSPIVVGYLVQVSGGNFNTAFIFLIAATLASSLVAVTIKERKAEVSVPISVSK